MINATAKLLETLPNPIKVGPYDFAVVTQPEPITDDDGTAFGHISLQTQTITLVVDDTTTPKQVVGLLVHEILHALWDGANLPKRPDEERVVLAYEYGIVALMRDNPKLLAWFKKGLK